MNLLEPYHGTYCNASSANEKIDIQAILSGCDAVDEEANHISEYAGTLRDYSSVLNEKVLSISGETMINTANECCEDINNVENEIMSITTQIREAVVAVYNKIQDQLNNEAYIKDQDENNKRLNASR